MHPRPIETVNAGATASAGSRRPARPSRKPASCAPQPPGPRPLQRPASPTATESSCSLLRPGTPMDPRAALPLAKRGSWQARNIGAATIRLCRPPHQCPASLFQVQLSRPLGPVSGRRFTTPTASARQNTTGASSLPGLKRIRLSAPAKERGSRCQAAPPGEIIAVSESATAGSSSLWLPLSGPPKDSRSGRPAREPAQQFRGIGRRDSALRAVSGIP